MITYSTALVHWSAVHLERCGRLRVFNGMHMLLLVACLWWTWQRQPVMLALNSSSNIGAATVLHCCLGDCI
jgi:hypothetical protein